MSGATLRRVLLGVVALVVVGVGGAGVLDRRDSPVTPPRFDLSIRSGRSLVPGFDRRYLAVGAVPGQIPAIQHPRFDSAREASRLLDPSEPVIGVDIAGDARAYPIKVLALHEAVNDVVGGRPLLVTWCPLCSSALVFDRRVAGRILAFEISGLLFRANQVLVDQQTRSLWSQLGDGAVTGSMRGHRLLLVPAAQQPWKAWRSRHPGTRVLSIRHDAFAHRFIHPYTYADDRGEESTDDPYLGYKQKVPVYYGRSIEGVSGAARVVAVQRGGRSKVYPDLLVLRRIVVDDRFAGVPLSIFWSSSNYTPGVFSRRLDGRVLSFRWDGSSIRDTATGSRWSASTGRAVAGRLAGEQLRPLPFSFPYWFAWHNFHPRAIVARGR